MALIKETVNDQIEILPDGLVQVRFSKQVNDAGDITKIEYHRASFVPGVDVQAQMGLINTHLVSMGYGGVSTSDIAKIKAQAEAAWTPEVISAYQAFLNSAIS